MITVITEHSALLTIKAGLQATRTAAASNTLKAQTAGIADAVNRALGDTTTALDTAIDRLTMGDGRLGARRAFAVLGTDITELAHVDNVLWAAALLPADIDADYDLARLRARRETITANITRTTAFLVNALADARLDVPDDGQASA
jgi:hypothetical protein